MLYLSSLFSQYNLEFEKGVQLLFMAPKRNVQLASFNNCGQNQIVKSH